MGKRLLCIDDELTGLEIRKIFLESQGYIVLIAAQGMDGIDMFKHETVDAVVLDYYMPGMNGAAVSQELKRLRPDVPIILLSAFGVDSSDATVRVDAYVMKGENPKVLLETLDDLLRRAA